MDRHLEDQFDFKDFLEEADLEQYYTLFRDILKVTKLSQLKFVDGEDLTKIGLSRPEQRQYKKVYAKHFPNVCVMKLRKILRSNRRHENLPRAYPTSLDLPPFSRSDGKVPIKHIIPIEDITIDHELGTGEFGIVQQGIWTIDNQRVQVAIKCLGPERMDSDSVEFLKEAAVMHSIDHPNIIRLFGVVLQIDSLMLVTELAPYRSLLDCLREARLRREFTLPILIKFALQICDGMIYLEGKRLIHRDLAIRNILVFSKELVKISDFGLSRALGDKDYYEIRYNVNLKLPIAWCAPECILYLRFTSASDVWSYGICLWEMFTYGCQPWGGMSAHQILKAIDVPNLQMLVKPFMCPDIYYKMMLKCWCYEPQARPKFKELGVKLHQFYSDQLKSDKLDVPLKMDTENLPTTSKARGKHVLQEMSNSKSDKLDALIKMDTQNLPTTSKAEEEHVYQEISNYCDSNELTGNQSEEMGSMFKGLSIAAEENNFLLKSQPQHDVPTRAQTLCKTKKKRSVNTNTMKPMSAHDQKTLDTAVAMANELTARSMTDLEDNNQKPVSSPNDRSRFHFKFPLGLGSRGLSHEPQKSVPDKHGGRNFSEQAKGVPDLQATLTEESKLAYISLIEEPVLSTRMAEDLGTNDFLQQSSNKYLKPRRVTSSVTQFSNVEKSNNTNKKTNQGARSGRANVLPLPPRTENTRLVDKPRHKRKYPLVLPNAYPQYENEQFALPYNDREQAASTSQETTPKIYQNVDMGQYLDEACGFDPSYLSKNLHYQNIIPTRSTDTVDGSSPRERMPSGSRYESDTSTDTCNNNLFTDESYFALPKSVNPFTTPEETVSSLNAEKNASRKSSSSNLQESDHVSVEDLLEFADLKPCGRQRGIESDEVRIMCKVLKEEVTPETCLQALEYTDWDVHQAIKMMLCPQYSSI